MHGDAGDGLLVRGVVLDEQVRARVPHLEGAVRAARGHQVALGVEGHAVHRAAQRETMSVLVLQSDRCREVRRIVYIWGSHSLGVVVEGVQRLVRGHVPQLHRLVVAARRRCGRVGTEAGCSHPVTVSYKRTGKFSRWESPYLWKEKKE